MTVVSGMRMVAVPIATTDESNFADTYQTNMNLETTHKTGWDRPRSIRRKQIATIRMPPKSKTMSPMLNSPSCAWSANSGNRVCKVPPCHIGLAGCTEDGIPITGIDPALVFVTRAFIPSPQSISKTPVRTTGDRTARNTSHRIAQDAHSQIAGCSIHAK
jgi:hypothetical protein